MITFSQLGNYGRLGNQLFQYAILVAISNKRGYEIKIPNFNNNEWHHQKCLLNNFNISANFVGENDKIKYNYYESNGFNYSYIPRIFDVLDDTNIHGFFQNHEYYKDCEDILIKELMPKENIIQNNLKIMNEIKSKYIGYDIVSLHLRRGDTQLNMYGNDLNNLDVNSKWYKYFIEAKKQFQNKKIKFMVFTGGKRAKIDNGDYSWCKKNLVGDDFIYFDYERSVINDFTLMLLCDHHILSPISTLSWWVGFLNKKKANKLIIAPKKYYFLEKELEIGFYPNNFILI